MTKVQTDANSRRRHGAPFLRRFAPPVGVPQVWLFDRSSLRRFAPPVGVPQVWLFDRSPIQMTLTRREALAQLAALVAVPLVGGGRDWRFMIAGPLEGTIAEYQSGRARGQWTAARITAEAVERCRTQGMSWRAIDQMATNLTAIARDSDLRLRKGRLFGMLDGVPVFAKSIYDMNGLKTTGSNAQWAASYHELLRRDALEITRLRAAGAVVLGKTAADDFAYHGNGTSSLTGQVLNPYDSTKTRTPGGSSAGSAVAVAGGMAFAALGTDDGGSNRIPAQFTGVVGVKPTFGLVARKRRHPDVAVPRHARIAGADRGRRGADARRDRRCRSRGSADASRRVERSHARRFPRCATTHSSVCGSASSTRTFLARR